MTQQTFWPALMLPTPLLHPHVCPSLTPPTPQCMSTAFACLSDLLLVHVRSAIHDHAYLSPTKKVLTQSLMYCFKLPSHPVFLDSFPYVLLQATLAPCVF